MKLAIVYATVHHLGYRQRFVVVVSNISARVHVADLRCVEDGEDTYWRPYPRVPNVAVLGLLGVVGLVAVELVTVIVDHVDIVGSEGVVCLGISQHDSG